MCVGCIGCILVCFLGVYCGGVVCLNEFWGVLGVLLMF